MSAGNPAAKLPRDSVPSPGRITVLLKLRPCKINRGGDQMGWTRGSSAMTRVYGRRRLTHGWLQLCCMPCHAAHPGPQTRWDEMKAMLYVLTSFGESAELVFTRSGRLNSSLSGEWCGSRELRSLQDHRAGKPCFPPSVKGKANFHLHPA